MFDTPELRRLDELVGDNHYSDETYAGLLPYMAAYLEAAVKLRALPLTETKGMLVMLAGGRR
jgi:hypothetical protein